MNAVVLSWVEVVREPLGATENTCVTRPIENIDGPEEGFQIAVICACGDKLAISRTYELSYLQDRV